MNSALTESSVRSSSRWMPGHGRRRLRWVVMVVSINVSPRAPSWDFHSSMVQRKTTKGTGSPAAGGVPVPVWESGSQGPGQAPAPRQRRGSGASPYRKFNGSTSITDSTDGCLGKSLAADNHNSRISSGVSAASCMWYR